MKKIILFSVFMLSLLFGAMGQKNCGFIQPPYDEALEQQIRDYVSSNNRSVTTTITVPVVFHIIWKTGYPAQNVSDAQVYSQLQALNRDFSLSNTDAANTPPIFTPANPNIQFCLATRDPNGNATTGIIRRETSAGPFNAGNLMSFYYQGGDEAWGTTSSSSCPYLNIYVCDLASGIGGVGGSALVAIDYSSFGMSSSSTYGLGRTGTHEVGHWLNLVHIWGNATCGDDLVSDTPQHNTQNYGCPTYPHYSTCTGTPIEMTMNYMDYTNDNCMYMFSQGQVDRMRASLTTTGNHSGILTSLGCSTPLYTSCIVKNLGVTVPELGKFRVAWLPVEGATSYTLQYSTTPSFSSIAQFTVTSTDTTITPTPTTTNTSNVNLYYVRVKANCSGQSAFAPQLSVFVDQFVGVNRLDPILTGGSSSGGGSGGTTVCADNNEPNNSVTSTKSISVNTDVVGAISSATDQDWFSFSTTKQQKNVQVVLSNLATNYDLQLYTGTGTLLATSANAGTSDETIVANNLAQGTYKVKVYTTGGVYDAADCYTLRVNRSGTSYRLEADNAVFFDGSTDEVPNVFIYTITGALLDVKDTEELSTGIYIIKYQYKNTTYIERIVK